MLAIFLVVRTKNHHQKQTNRQKATTIAANYNGNSNVHINTPGFIFSAVSNGSYLLVLFSFYLITSNTNNEIKIKEEKYALKKKMILIKQQNSKTSFFKQKLLKETMGINSKEKIAYWLYTKLKCLPCL
jgi:hypothetical protein